MFVHMSTLAVVSWCRVDNRVSVCEALRKYWLPRAPALLSPVPQRQHAPTSHPRNPGTSPQCLRDNDLWCVQHTSLRGGSSPQVCLAPSEMSLITSSRCQQSLWNKCPCLIFVLNMIKLVAMEIDLMHNHLNYKYSVKTYLIII